MSSVNNKSNILHSWILFTTGRRTVNKVLLEFMELYRKILKWKYWKAELFCWCSELEVSIQGYSLTSEPEALSLGKGHSIFLSEKDVLLIMTLKCLHTLLKGPTAYTTACSTSVLISFSRFPLLLIPDLLFAWLQIEVVREILVWPSTRVQLSHRWQYRCHNSYSKSPKEKENKS